MKHLLKLFALLLPILCLSLGCTSNPMAGASELRALHKEALAQVNEMSADPNISAAKVTELKERLQQAEPFISAIEVAAAQAQNDPTKWISFQQLYVEYKPKIRALLISIVIKRYLGVDARPAAHRPDVTIWCPLHFV